MRGIKVVFILVVMMPVFIFSMLAETIEEQMLKQKEAKLKVYQISAKTGDRKTKSDLLDKIYSEFDDAKYSSKDADLMDLAVYLSEEGSIRKEYLNNTVSNDFPEVRRKAVILLQKLGGPQAREALINVLVSDKNSTVKAEVCNALTQVKDNEKGDALRALVYVYRTTYKPDANLVFAIINAVKEIAKSNSSYYAESINILSELQMGNYNRKVREAAYDAIEELSGVKKTK
jgi:hypothetical protein